jgi:vancomycin permeability regulator SanA
MDKLIGLAILLGSIGLLLLAVRILAAISNAGERDSYDESQAAPGRRIAMIAGGIFSGGGRRKED